jgi:hypothetical protein
VRAFLTLGLLALCACDDDDLSGRKDGGADGGEDGGPPPLALSIGGLDPEAMYRSRGTVKLVAEPTGAGIKWCRFSIDLVDVGQVTSAPFEVSVDLSTLAVGRHLVVLDATSDDGRNFESAAAALHVDRVPQAEVDGALAVGAYYAYAGRGLGSGYRMYAVPAAGGRPRSLGAVAAGAYRASPARAEVAFRAEDGTLKRADLSGDTAEAATLASGASFHGYLSDGTLAFTKTDLTLWVAPPGGAARQIATGVAPGKLQLLGAAAVLYQTTLGGLQGDLRVVSPAQGGPASAEIAAEGVLWDHRDAWGDSAASHVAYLAGVNATSQLGDLRASPLPAVSAGLVSAGVRAGDFWLAPGGTEILWRTGDGELHLRDGTGTASLGAALLARWAPDRSAAAWIAAAGGLFVRALAGPTPVSALLDEVAEFKLAAGGRAAALAALSAETQSGTLHAGNRDGVAEVSAGVPRGGYHYSPGAGHLAFVRAWDALAADGEAAVVALGAEGRPEGGVRALGTLVPASGFHWSADGRWLAVLRKPEIASAQLDAWVTDVNAGSTPRKMLEAAVRVGFTANDVYAIAADPLREGERPLVVHELTPP